MKLICFGFYSITRNKWRYISDKSMLTRIKIFTRSSLGSSSSFIRLFCLITLIPLIYLITLYKFIYGVDLSWTRLDQSPAILHDLALILDLPHRSNSCLLLFPPFFIRLPFKVQRKGTGYLVAHAFYITL